MAAAPVYGIYGIQQEPACLGFRQWISEINFSKVNDAYFRFVCDMGKPGPDKGDGGQEKQNQPPFRFKRMCMLRNLRVRTWKESI